MDPAEIALVGLIVLVGHAIGGIAAYGSVLVALPFLVLATGEREASVLLLLVLGMTQAALILLRTWRHIEKRALWTMLLLAGAGLPFGFYFARALPERPVMLALGAIVAASGLSRLIGALRAPGPEPDGRAARSSPRPSAPQPRVPERAPGAPGLPGAQVEASPELPVRRMLVRLLVLAGGVIHGAFGAGGATLVIYAQGALPRKESFRGTMCVVWLCLNPLVLGAKLLDGGVPARLGWWLPAGLPFLIAGNWIAQRVAERIHQRRFAQFVALLLVISGTVLLARNLSPKEAPPAPPESPAVSTPSAPPR